MEDIEDVFECLLERPAEEVQGKNWIKKSFAKKWKKVFCVLRKYSSSDQAFLQIFEKEDKWRQQMPKGTLELFPRYRVLKKFDVKGKPYVFEVSNDVETYVLAAESETVLDLWVIQLQMQTRLNPRISGKTFRTKCCGSKAMQRIGAKDQHCLLHISRWGVTLALERTRAVLAQWPLTTIRNYECMDRGEFSFEAGRRAPMGEGKYTFLTQPGEDNLIFDTIDGFTSARLAAHESRGGGAMVQNSEEDVSMAYDQLRFSVLNIPSDTFDRDGSIRGMDMSSAPRSIATANLPSSYDHIDRSDSIGSARSLGSFSPSMDPSMSYSSLDRHSSFGSQTEGPRPNYDTLDHARSMVSMSFKEGSRGLGRAPSGYNHISTASMRGTPDFYRRDPHTCPLEVSPEAEENLFPSGGLLCSPGFSSSGDYSKLDGHPVDVASSKTLTEEQAPPPLPARGRTLPALGSKKTKLKDSRQEKLSSKQGNEIVHKTSMSPNFVYLNASYSNSIEVLPALYATVDKEKKKRDREKKAMKKAKCLEEKRSRSYESLSGSPRFNSFSFTPFSFKGLALMDSDSIEGSGSLKDPSSDESFNFSGEMVSPKAPHSDRVSMAYRGTLDRDGELMGRGTLGTTSYGMTSSCSLSSREVTALHNTLSQSPQLGLRKKEHSSEA